MQSSKKKNTVIIICVAIVVFVVALILCVLLNTDKEVVPYPVDVETIKNVETPLPAVYAFFENENKGIVLCVGDQAMGTYALQAYKTEDGGASWSLQTNENGENFISVRIAAEYLFVSLETGFIFDPSTGDRDARLRMTTNGGITFHDLDFVDDTITDFNNGTISLPKDEVYDYYELPTYEKGVITVNVSQGSDGDIHGGRTVLEYRSKDNGMTWEFVKEFER